MAARERVCDPAQRGARLLQPSRFGFQGERRFFSPRTYRKPSNRNEVVYVVVKGEGRFRVDGAEFDTAEGSVIRVDITGPRCIAADSQSPLSYIRMETEAKRASSDLPKARPD